MTAQDASATGRERAVIDSHDGVPFRSKGMNLEYQPETQQHIRQQHRSMRRRFCVDWLQRTRKKRRLPPWQLSECENAAETLFIRYDGHTEKANRSSGSCQETSCSMRV